MKKYIKVLFILICIFVFQNNIKAALKCTYSDGNLTATYTIESESKVTKAVVNGNLKSSDETVIKEEKQKIENWDKIFKAGDISARGDAYYKNYKQCPPYLIFVDRKGQFDLAVFSDSHYDEFKKYGQSKQGYAIMKLTSSEDKTVTDPNSSKYEGNSCWDYTEQSCENNGTLSCVWNEKFGGYCNTDNLLYIACGDANNIPYQVPQLVSFAVNFLKIATPIILIIVSIISLVKALSASKEDEIKKAQQSLIKKIIAAIMVFFIISIVQFVILKVADSSEVGNVTNCMSCLLNNDCESSIYYKTNVGGIYICRYVDGTYKGNC